MRKQEKRKGEETKREKERKRRRQEGRIKRRRNQGPLGKQQMNQKGDRERGEERKGLK